MTADYPPVHYEKALPYRHERNLLARAKPMLSGSVHVYEVYPRKGSDRGSKIWPNKHKKR